MNAKDSADATKIATLSLGNNQQTQMPVRSGTIGPDETFARLKDQAL